MSKTKQGKNQSPVGSPNDTYGSGVPINDDTLSGAAQVPGFAALQGKTLSFKKSSGYYTSKNKTNPESNNPFKQVNLPQNINVSPRISKPIVMVTKRSEKSSPLGSSEKTPGRRGERPK